MDRVGGLLPESVTFIISPYHVGIRNHRVGDGPNRILQWNVISETEKLGVRTRIVEIGPVDKFEGEIGRSFEVLRQTSRLVTAARSQNSFPVILAGNCMTSVGVACGLGLQDLKFIVFDAHDDMNTPSTTKSGYLDGMGWSMLSGKAFETLYETVPGHEVSRGNVYQRFLYCGLRDVNDDERKTVQESGATVIWGSTKSDYDYKSELESHLDRSDCSPALIHLDLDVLDESLGKVNDFSCPGGLQEEDLISCMAITARAVTPVALTVASFDPNLGAGHDIARIAVKAIVHFIKTLTDKCGISVKRQDQGSAINSRLTQ